jgi:hypothetical protein
MVFATVQWSSGVVSNYNIASDMYSIASGVTLLSLFIVFVIVSVVIRCHIVIFLYFIVYRQWYPVYYIIF